MSALPVGSIAETLAITAETESLIPGAVTAAGMALITLWLLLRMRKRRRETNRRSEAVQEQLRPSTESPRSPRRPSTTARADLDAAMVQIQEITRECAAQIDNRVSRLEHVLRLVDERIRTLEQAAGRQPDEPIRMDPTLRLHASLQSPPAAPAGEVHTTPISLADGGRVDPLTRQVHELADRGLAPVEIAQQLNEPTGKVELILALRHATA